MDIIKIPKNAAKFICETCDFTCSKQSNFNKHLSTGKHINNCKGYKNDMDKSSKNSDNNIACECGKTYNYYSGLWRHKKKCNYIRPTIEYNSNNSNNNNNLVEVLIKENMDFKNVILELVKSNTDLQKQMLEVCKHNNTIINNSTNTNSHNKTFNMQFFLNEQCKDAMNLMDFVDTFNLQFSDLERVGEVGYVEGISGIIIKKLNEMDIYKRPIHCSDAKRETLYVKDNNIWEKENGNHNKLRLAIKHITKKNTDMLNPWRIKHPGSCDSDNYLNDIYLEMVMQAMGGRGGMEENENKIIKKIAKNVLIDKM